MNNGISPRINMFERIESNKLDSIGQTRFKSIEQPETQDFSSVFSGLVENLNNDINAPDQVLNDAMQGNADVHDVMVAIQKADIETTLATTVVGKVVQAYEKITQISI